MSEAGQQPTRNAMREFANSLSDEEIIAQVKRQPPCDSRGWQVTGLPYPASNPLVYIKYGDNHFRSRDAEARSHQYAFEALQRIPAEQRQGIFIPEIYRVLYHPGFTYIVMEYVSGKTLGSILEDWQEFKKRSEYFHSKIEQALKLLLSFPVPMSVPPGPAGGGIIKHPLFNSHYAPIPYDSVTMLEDHLNKVSTVIRPTAPKVQLERDLHFVFSDLYEGNFMFNDAGDLFVIDFEEAAFLPLSFMSYAMQQHHYICGVLRDKLQLPSKNVAAMRHICSLFVKSYRQIGPLPVNMLSSSANKL